MRVVRALTCRSTQNASAAAAVWKATRKESPCKHRDVADAHFNEYVEQDRGTNQRETRSSVAWQARCESHTVQGTRHQIGSLSCPRCPHIPGIWHGTLHCFLHGPIHNA